MRRLLSGVVVLGVFTVLPLVQACSDDRAEADASVGTATSASTSAEAIPAGLARADFDIAGMDCGGCVIGTRAALRKLDGVQKADASYDDATGKGAAWAVYDPSKVTAERMIAAIRELGYTPTLVQAQS
ncbi:MAG: heavy-metal-associated domain-containing protein [Gemmatimonadota bacterium]